MKKLVITDLDDTLYDWIGFFVPAFYSMVDEIVKITSIDKNIILKEFKEKHQEYGSVEYPYVTLQLPSIKKIYQSYEQDQIKIILGEAFHRFNSVRKEKLKLYNGVKETLEILFQNDITIIGYTESSQENGYYRLKKLGIDKYFKHVYVSKSDFKLKIPLSEKVLMVDGKKPNKQILIDICEKEQCKLDETIYVGDSLTKDIYMAGKAGIDSVWVNYPKGNNNFYTLLVEITSWTESDFKREADLKKEYIDSDMSPNYTINSFDELLKIIENMRG